MIRAVVIFLVYLAITILAFVVISQPMELLFDIFETADLAEAKDEMRLYITPMRTAFNIFTALIIAAPFTWLVMYVFSREPAYYQRRL